MSDKSKKRYNVYDKVWVMFKNKPTELIVFAVIESMSFNKQDTEILYNLVTTQVGAAWGVYTGMRYSENSVFSSKQSLIQSLQIDCYE